MFRHLGAPSPQVSGLRCRASESGEPSQAVRTQREATAALATAYEALQAAVLGAREDGATWQAMSEATGWPLHSLRMVYYRALPDDHEELPESLRKRRPKPAS